MIIIQCDPDVIMLSWCYSLNGDVSMLLRSEGVFSLMILNNDLRIITSNPLARLNDTQRQIIKETGRDVMLLQSHPLSFFVSFAWQDPSSHILI